MERRQFIQRLGLGGLAAGSVAGAGASAASAASLGPDLITFADFEVGPASILVAAANAPAEICSVAHERCSGTDDQVKIAAAFARLGSVGGTVQLSEGTFSISAAVSMPARCQLLGKGRATVLEATGTWDAYDGSSPGAVVEAASISTDKTAVANLTIGGNRYGNAATVKGLYYNITSDDDFDEGPDAAHTFTDLYIARTASHGLDLRGSRCRASKVARIRVWDAGSSASDVNSFRIECPDGFYTQCESGSSSGSGFLIMAANNRFTSCKSWYSDGTGFYLQSAVRNQFSACEAQDNEQHGFFVGSGPNSFVGCHADSNSWNSVVNASSYDGFHMPYGSRIQLVGCSAYDKNESGRGNWQRFGFYLHSSTSHCQIIGTVVDNVSGGVGGGGDAVATNMVMVTG